MTTDHLAFFRVSLSDISLVFVAHVGSEPLTLLDGRLLESLVGWAFIRTCLTPVGWVFIGTCPTCWVVIYDTPPLLDGRLLEPACMGCHNLPHLFGASHSILVGPPSTLSASSYNFLTTFTILTAMCKMLSNHMHYLQVYVLSKVITLSQVIYFVNIMLKNRARKKR